MSDLFLNERGTMRNAATDNVADKSLVHVIWSMSKDLRSSSIRTVRAALDSLPLLLFLRDLQLFRSLLSLFAHILRRTVRLVLLRLRKDPF